MKPSGKFVLRVEPNLHESLQKEARNKSLSLNQLVISKITQGKASHAVLDLIEKTFPNQILGVVVFGSYVRGEMNASSDIDLLIVLKEDDSISRNLYEIWDKMVSPKIKENYSPQFVNSPTEFATSSLWLEVALEGEILLDPTGSLRKHLYKLKELIAGQVFVRKISHGHPYWIRSEQDAK